MTFEDSLRNLPAPGGNGYHTAIMGAANLGAMQGLTADDIFAAIKSNTPAGSRHVPDNEIWKTVNKAIREFDPSRRVPDAVFRPRSKPSWNPESYMQKLLRKGKGKTEEDVWNASPVRLDWGPESDTIETLARLYTPEDRLFIGDRYDSEVKSVAEWLVLISQGKSWPHIIPNPLTGETALTKSGDKTTTRGDNCVKAYRFAVVEFDNMTREDQLAFWWAAPLPVCALIDSGGKSIHGWIKIDNVTSSDEWTHHVEVGLFEAALVPLGVDSACKNESRLSRLPGHERAETNRWQRLLYLAPEGRRVCP